MDSLRVGNMHGDARMRDPSARSRPSAIKGLPFPVLVRVLRTGVVYLTDKGTGCPERESAVIRIARILFSPPRSQEVVGLWPHLPLSSELPNGQQLGRTERQTIFLAS